MSLETRILALAQAVGADIKALIAGKVDKATGKGLSTNDYSTTEKNKLASLIPTGSNLEITPGRLIKVGDFGANGGDVINLATDVSWDTITIPASYYVEGASGINAPVAGSYSFLTVSRNGSIIKQSARLRASAVTLERFYNGATWSGWDATYSRSTILGTVGYAGGLPTGAIISNVLDTATNIRVIKWADGTSWAIGNVAATPVGANQTANVTANMPSGTFTGTSVVFATCSPSTSQDWYGVTYAFFVNVNQISIFCRNGATPQTFQTSYIAVGRWY